MEAFYTGINIPTQTNIMGFFEHLFILFRVAP